MCLFNDRSVRHQPPAYSAKLLYAILNERTIRNATGASHPVIRTFTRKGLGRLGRRAADEQREEEWDRVVDRMPED